MRFFIDCGVQISVLLLIAIASMPLLRKRSAALRHWMLSAAILIPAVTPAIKLVLPPLSLAIPVTHSALLEQAQPAPRIETSTSVALPSSLSRRSRFDMTQRFAASMWVTGMFIGVFVIGTGCLRLARIAR